MTRRAYADLADYFEHSGDTQQAFAQRLGVSQSHISRIASRLAEPSLDLALKISDEAHIPVETLLPVASQAIDHAGGRHA